MPSETSGICITNDKDQLLLIYQLRKQVYEFPGRVCIGRNLEKSVVELAMKQLDCVVKASDYVGWYEFRASQVCRHHVTNAIIVAGIPKAQDDTELFWMEPKLYKGLAVTANVAGFCKTYQDGRWNQELKG